MYIINDTQQKKLLERLVLLDTLEGGWKQKFIDPTTKIEWVLFHHHSEMQGGGRKILRKSQIPETLEDRLAESFSSGNEDDVVGLAWELSDNYKQWPAVLDWLEVNSTSLPAQQVGLFLDNLEIFHISNKRSIVGKDTQEIENDFRFFQDLSRKAMKLIGAG